MEKTNEGNEHENKKRNKRSYWSKRSNLIYYQYIDLLVRALARDANSLIDVGSAKAQYIEAFDWIPKKNTLDINKPYSSEKVVGIKTNFFDFEPEEKYDFAICLQVLEHAPNAKSFARKLFQVADRVLISVPYLWESDRLEAHVHDPVDLDKLLYWTGREPDYHMIIEEPFVNTDRLISY